MNVDPLAAVHVQVVALAVTPTEPVPPSGGKEATLGCPTVNVHVDDGVDGVLSSPQAATNSAVAMHAPQSRSLLD
jgi:hypothetical protein